MECAQRTAIQNKLKLLFKKLEEPNYVIDNYYADGLINKLASCSDPDVQFLGTVPLISDLIIEVLEQIEHAHVTVRVFVARILAIAARKELHFAKIFSKHGEKILARFKEVYGPSVTNPSIRVAFMEVAIAISTHTSGVLWILETGVWKDIIQLYHQRTTVFIVRQIDKFIADFVWRLNDMADLPNTRNVISHLIQPFVAIDFLNVESLSSDEEAELCKVIEPVVKLLLVIISQENRIETDTIVVNLMLKEFKIASYVYVALDWIRKEDTNHLLAKLTFWLALAKMFLQKPYSPGVVYTEEDFLEVGASNYNTIQTFVQRRSATSVVDFCSSCIIIGNGIFKNKQSIWPMQVSDENVKKNQMLFICLVPVLLFVTHGKLVSQITKIRISDYIERLLSTSCQYTAKAAYALRDLTEELDTMSIILYTVKKLLHLKEHLNDEQANLLFQALFYVLQDYNPLDDYGEFKVEEAFEDSEEKNLAMTYVMDCVSSLVTHRNINWHESIEIVCLYNVVCSILKRTNLCYKFVVKSLDVITLTVKKFLQPNLSLLMDSKPGSAIHDLGTLIYMKMQDRQWEIRDTALELLYVCTDISFIKFPPFQKQIQEHNLINLAATIVFNDFEPYVQVSALKCIGAACRIGSIWDQFLAEYPDIQERLLYILLNNTEGNVRKEACKTLCEIYLHHKIPPASRQVVLQHMASSALSDFHWEVQISALKFWRRVYQFLLTNHGMLDGTFPPVTFSKETRKIVTLNDAEIKKILLKILDDLAANGCLTVFVRLLQDDTEVEILDAALKISQELYDILNKYKIPELVTPKPNDVTTIEELMANIKEQDVDDDDNTDEAMDMTHSGNPENVIEDILNADDANLLSSIYERHMTLKSKKIETPLIPKIKLHKFASPYLFVKHLKNNDFKQIIEEKRRWNEGIRNISSLLDDVLGLYEMDGEFNALDCY